MTFVAAVFVLGLASPAWTDKAIASVPLEAGREQGENVLTGPVYLGSEAAPIFFEALVDTVSRDSPIMRFPRPVWCPEGASFNSPELASAATPGGLTTGG